MIFDNPWIGRPSPDLYGATSTFVQDAFAAGNIGIASFMFFIAGMNLVRLKKGSPKEKARG